MGIKIAQAKVGDFYLDDSGKVWKVFAIAHRPTITLQCLELPPGYDYSTFTEDSLMSQKFTKLVPEKPHGP